MSGRRLQSVLLVVIGIFFLAGARVEAALVAHWQFDESSGTVAEDVAGGNNGTLINFPGDDSQWQPGIIGNALDFDGNNDYVEHSFNLPRAEGTIAHWLNPNDVGPHGITVYESDSPGSGALYDGFGDPATMLEIHSGVDNERWQARYQDGDGSGGENAAGGGRFGRAPGAPAAVPNEWTHVAMTWDTAGDLVIYVNCQEASRRSMAEGSFDNLTTTERFIGRPSANTRFWNGLIDDVRIYDTALDQAGIEDAAQSCPSSSSPELSLDPAELAFGTAAPGDSATATATVTNIGDADLEISTIGAPGAPFAVTGGDCQPAPTTLAPDESCDIVVAFEPDAPGNFTDEIILSSNASSSPDSLDLSGSAASTSAVLSIPAVGSRGLMLFGLFVVLTGWLAADRRSGRE